MTGKKLVTLTLIMLFVLALMGGLVAAEDECPAAPAVAVQILQDNDIDFRYEAGTVEHPKHGERITYENYISMVAQTMTNEAAFPAYECNFEWDGETYVDKCDEEAYYWAVYNYLRLLGADLECPCSGVLDPEASGAVATNNADGTVTLEITVVDLCGNPIPGLNPLSDFYVMDSVITGTFYFGTSSIPGSTDWDEDDGVYSVTLSRNFFNARPAGYEDGWYRIWDIYVLGELVEEALELSTTYWAVGDWKLNLYTGSTLHERFIIINSHIDGEIDGFFGVGYDPEGNATGTITGTILGRSIDMFYDRTGYGDDGYHIWFAGTIAEDGNSMSGTWYDNRSYTTPQGWNMIRQ